MKLKQILRKIKRFIKELIPKYVHFDVNSNKKISIHGTRRGGTTFLCQLLSNRRTRVVDQAFEFYDRGYISRIRHLKANHLPFKEKYVYYDLTTHEEKKVKTFIQLLSIGKFSYYDNKLSFFKDRIIFKNCNANYILPIFKSLGFKTIILFRHPYRQSLSCLRNNWDHVYDAYFKCKSFTDKYFSKEKLEKIKYMEKKMTEIEKYVLDWYCNNAELINLRNKNLTVYLEDFIFDFDSTCEKIEKELNINLNRKIRFKASKTSLFSAKDFEMQLQNKNLISYEYKKFDRINEELKNKLQHLFDILNINIYDMSSPKPNKEN